MERWICANGHYFDREKFTVCPVCGAQAVRKDERSSGIRPVNGKAEVSGAKDDVSMNGTVGKTIPLNNGNRSSEKGSDPVHPTEKLNGVPVADETPYPELVLQPKPTGKNRFSSMFEVEETQKHQEEPDNNDFSGSTDSDMVSEEEYVIENKSAGKSLSQEIRETGADETSALPLTTAYYDLDYLPPVGWLVCVRGKYLGQAFECHDGKNRIGRNPGLEICLTDESSIDRAPQALIVYEPIQRKFTLMPGSGRGLVYLNGKNVLESMDLRPYDRLQLGKADFIFIPLCGSQFTWRDYLKG